MLRAAASCYRVAKFSSGRSITATSTVLRAPPAPAPHTANARAGRRPDVRAYSSHSREELEEVAQERFGLPYDELTTDQKKSVGGVIGGRVR